MLTGYRRICGLSIMGLDEKSVGHGDLLWLVRGRWLDYTLGAKMGEKRSKSSVSDYAQ